PGLLLGKEIQDSKPVALSGRVPVKVNLENGPIKRGDYLTLSSTPGVAMKATESGQTIGVALQNYTEETETNTIVTFVNLSYQRLSTNIQAGKITLETAWSIDEDTGYIKANNTLDLNSFSIENVLAIRSANDSWSIDEE